MHSKIDSQLSVVWSDAIFEECRMVSVISYSSASLPNQVSLLKLCKLFHVENKKTKSTHLAISLLAKRFLTLWYFLTFYNLTKKKICIDFLAGIFFCYYLEILKNNDSHRWLFTHGSISSSGIFCKPLVKVSLPWPLVA